MLEPPPPPEWRDAALATMDLWLLDDPWALPPALPLPPAAPPDAAFPRPCVVVVVVAPEGAFVVETPDFDRVPAAVVGVVARAGPVPALPVVGGADGGAGVAAAGVVVVAAAAGVWAGGTSVDALQICA